MCVHLNMLKRGRSVQLERLYHRVTSSVPVNHPLIVAGDFNDWSQHASNFLMDGAGLNEVFFSLHGAHATTYPSRFPVLRLDRIYARGLEAVDGEILSRPPWSQLSDHAALYAELVVPGETTRSGSTQL
jgi:endonuclease/exonuclease/phosphatase family metal-dependent hydrolase